MTVPKRPLVYYNPETDELFFEGRRYTQGGEASGVDTPCTYPLCTEASAFFWHTSEEESVEAVEADPDLAIIEETVWSLLQRVRKLRQ